MEGWRQRRLGSMGTIWKKEIRNEEGEKREKIKERRLTLTGLLMEGLVNGLLIESVTVLVVR
jgi:hypothetical protein